MINLESILKIVSKLAWSDFKISIASYIHYMCEHFSYILWIKLGYSMTFKFQIPIVHCWYRTQWTFVLWLLREGFVWKCTCVLSLLSSTVVLNSSIQGCYSWRIHFSFETLSPYTAPSDIARGRQFIGCLQDCRGTHLSHCSLLLLYKVWSLINQAVSLSCLCYFYSRVL